MTAYRSTRLLAGLITATIALAGCTCSTADQAVTATVSAVIPSGAAATTPVPLAGAAATTSAAAAATTSATAAAASTAAPSSRATAVPSSSVTTSLSKALIRPAIITSPADRATGVSPIAPIVIRATSGTLDTVRVTSPDGKSVAGTYTDDLTWTSKEPLAYNRRYRITATSTTGDGMKPTVESSFTTVKPTQTVYLSLFPNRRMNNRRP